MAKAKMDLLDRYAGMLSEHFTSVQIIVTDFRGNDFTGLYSAGSGDIFARVKATEKWLDKMDEIL